MKLKGKKAVVCGAGGFIGGHLVQSLLSNGVEVIRAVDIKPLHEWYQVSKNVESLALDLKDKDSCLKAPQAPKSSSNSPPTWAAWASSKTTKPSACSASSRTPT